VIKKLINPSPKKIKKAKIVYDLYCKLHSLHQVKNETGLAIDTIRKYIDLIEDINKRNKLSTKDRYYNIEDHPTESTESTESIQDINNIYNNNINNNILNIKENINNEEINNNKYINNRNEVITNNNNKLKDKLLLQELDDISFQYLGYLKSPSDKQLEKTSLKDHGIIAGILLDKKALLTHKKDNEVKNQSIIFNLFGDNKNLAQFIQAATGRQARLQSKPKNKYTPAANK